MSTVIVLAKSPVAGHVKTRLCPPLTAREAADIAEAALCDTLLAVASAAVEHRYVVLEGERCEWPELEKFRWLPQRSGSLAVSLEGAFEDVFADLCANGVPVGEPVVLVAMDTPQIAPRHLEAALASLSEQGVGAVMCPSYDGGYWLIGLRRADAAVFEGVPMSTPATGAAQLARLRSLGLDPVVGPTLRDIDTIDDLNAVSSAYPHLRVTSSWRSQRA